MVTRVLCAVLCGTLAVLTACSVYNPTINGEEFRCAEEYEYLESIFEDWDEPQDVDRDNDTIIACHRDIIPQCGRALGCDCDDWNSHTSPAEFDDDCNGQDNDCDGVIDEMSEQSTNPNCPTDGDTTGRNTAS